VVSSIGYLQESVCHDAIKGFFCASYEDVLPLEMFQDKDVGI